jgi:hypothetical protein
MGTPSCLLLCECHFPLLWARYLILEIRYILSRIYLHRHPLNDDLRLDRRPDLEHTDTLEKPILSGIKHKPRVVGPGPVIILLIIVVGLIAVTAEFVSIPQAFVSY